MDEPLRCYKWMGGWMDLRVGWGEEHLTLLKTIGGHCKEQIPCAVAILQIYPCPDKEWCEWVDHNRTRRDCICHSVAPPLPPGHHQGRVSKWCFICCTNNNIQVQIFSQTDQVLFQNIQRKLLFPHFINSLQLQCLSPRTGNQIRGHTKICKLA